MVSRFDLPSGWEFANKYQIISCLGAGLEGEVYLTKEKDTGIERAAKFFFPNRNLRNSSARRYAQKLFKIRSCPAIMQYHTHETVAFGRDKVTCLISEYIEGEPLEVYLKRQKNQRLHPFQATHLIHSILTGLAPIHALGEYHGDIHDANVFVSHVGLGYQVKLIDVIDWRDSRSANIKKDVCDVIRLYYDALGGQKHYSRLPQEVKDIILGLKTSLITRKFRNAQMLKSHIESILWSW